jgi:chromosome segregation ATPase
MPGEERTYSMEQPHLSSQIEYLEQRHQEDQAKMAELQQQTEAQAYELQKQARRLQSLEEELAEARLTLGRVPQLDERLDRFKDEVLQFIEERYGRRQQGSVSPTHPVTVQLETYTKTLGELRRELDRTRRYDEQISLARTELGRLSNTVNAFQASLDKLSKQLDERVQAARYMEEQRNVDARRLGELQADLATLQKKTETGLAKIQTVEQQVAQFSKYEIALEEVREEIRRHREHMDFQAAQRERQMKQWTEMAETQQRRMDEYENLMEKFAEHYQLNKRALASLQDFQERLQREQHQTEELQRLAEERQRTEMEKLQADYGHRWQKQYMEWKTQAEDLQKNVDNLKKRADEMARFNQTIEKQVNLILQLMEDDIQVRITTAQEWQQHFDDLLNGQT